jgi:hypothetical protein
VVISLALLISMALALHLRLSLRNGDTIHLGSREYFANAFSARVPGIWSDQPGLGWEVGGSPAYRSTVCWAGPVVFAFGWQNPSLAVKHSHHLKRCPPSCPKMIDGSVADPQAHAARLVR